MEELRAGGAGDWEEELGCEGEGEGEAAILGVKDRESKDWSDGVVLWKEGRVGEVAVRRGKHFWERN